MFAPHNLPDEVAIAIAIHANQGDRLVFELNAERPLVGVIGPAGGSPVPPKMKYHHLAPEVA